MKLNEVILNESLSQVVYHKTKHDAFYEIVRTNQFNLQLLSSEEVSDDYRTSGSKFYFASFARSPLSGFMQRPTGTVVMELDGRSLSANHKAKPVDFFSKQQVTKQDEMEDRLFSHEPVIKEFNRYIESVHVLDNNDVFNSIKDALDHLICKYNAEVFVYENNNDFRMLRNGKRYDPNKDSEYFEVEPNNEVDREDLQRNRIHYETLVHAIEFLDVDDFNKLSSEAQEELRFMQGTAKNFAFNVREAIGRIQPNNPITKEFVKRMKKHNIAPDNFKKLAEIIEDKWL